MTFEKKMTFGEEKNDIWSEKMSFLAFFVKYRNRYSTTLFRSKNIYMTFIVHSGQSTPLRYAERCQTDQSVEASCWFLIFYCYLTLFKGQILHEMDTRHIYELFLQLIGVSRGYNLVDIDFRWCIGIYVWKWGSGASIIWVGSGQLQKNGEKCSKIGSSKNSKKQQNIENLRNAPTYRYFLSLVGVSRLCNLVDVARRWYMKVVLSMRSSRIPIWWFDRGLTIKKC